MNLRNGCCTEVKFSWEYQNECKILAKLIDLKYFQLYFCNNNL